MIVMDPTTSTGPLAGVRVIDLTINVLGPVATQILGDMGADVIKIEPPQGDPMRDTGVSRRPGMSALFLNMNRNKRSVVLDLKKPKEMDALLRLVSEADVLVHSMRPGAAQRLGLEYSQLEKRFPRLIFAFAPGYDPNGPFRDKPAYDDVIQGESGIADMVERTTGTPRYLPLVTVDKTSGVFLASAISMALYSRERTGRGQQVQVPMLESMLAFNLIEHLSAGAYGEANGLGYGRALSAGRRPYKTKDGFMCVLAINDDQWRRLLSALGRPDVFDQPKFSTMSQRTQNINDLYDILSVEIAEHDSAELDSILTKADIPHGPMNRLSDLFSNTYLNETSFFQEYDHPTEGRLITTKIPQQFSSTPPSMRYPPPQLGQHTRSVLQEYGFSHSEIEALTEPN